MKYKDLVRTVNNLHNNGYFNNHCSTETHGTGPYNQFAYTTIGTCECPECIAHALAFGIDDHYSDVEITEEIIDKLKELYGINNLRDALIEGDKDSIQIFKPDGQLNLNS